MSYDAVVASIKQRLADNWATTPIRTQNAPEDPPMASDGSPLPWVYLEVLSGSDEQMSIGAPGNNTFRRTGIIAVHVFVPMKTGDDTALGYAVQIGAIYRGQSFGGVTCEGASIAGGDHGDDDGLWWRRSVTVPFWVDEAA
jgi:hypothetical protein